MVLERSWSILFAGTWFWNALLGGKVVLERSFGTQHIFRGKLVWEHSFGTHRLFVGTCPGMHFWNAFGTHFFKELALERSFGMLQQCRGIQLECSLDHAVPGNPLRPMPSPLT